MENIRCNNSPVVDHCPLPASSLLSSLSNLSNIFCDTSEPSVFVTTVLEQVCFYRSATRPGSLSSSALELFRTELVQNAGFSLSSVSVSVARLAQLLDEADIPWLWIVLMQNILASIAHADEEMLESCPKRLGAFLRAKKCAQNFAQNGANDWTRAPKTPVSDNGEQGVERGLNEHRVGVLYTNDASFCATKGIGSGGRRSSSSSRSRSGSSGSSTGNTSEGGIYSDGLPPLPLPSPVHKRARGLWENSGSSKRSGHCSSNRFGLFFDADSCFSETTNPVSIDPRLETDLLKWIGNASPLDVEGKLCGESFNSVHPCAQSSAERNNLHCAASSIRWPVRCLNDSASFFRSVDIDTGLPNKSLQVSLSFFQAPLSLSASSLFLKRKNAFFESFETRNCDFPLWSEADGVARRRFGEFTLATFDHAAHSEFFRGAESRMHSTESFDSSFLLRPVDLLWDLALALVWRSGPVLLSPTLFSAYSVQMAQGMAVRRKLAFGRNPEGFSSPNSSGVSGHLCTNSNNAAQKIAGMPTPACTCTRSLPGRACKCSGEKKPTGFLNSFDTDFFRSTLTRPTVGCSTKKALTCLSLNILKDVDFLVLRLKTLASPALRQFLKNRSGGGGGGSVGGGGGGVSVDASGNSGGDCDGFDGDGENRNNFGNEFFKTLPRPTQLYTLLVDVLQFRDPGLFDPVRKNGCNQGSTTRKSTLSREHLAQKRGLRPISHLYQHKP